MFARTISLFLICLMSTVFVGVLQATAASTRPFVIDTDMSVDDLMAILYLLQRSDISVEAITVTGTGVAHGGPGTQNVLGLLALAGNPDVPVARGRDNPLQGDHVFPEAWRVDTDNSYGVPLPENPNPPSSQTAVEMLSSVIQGSSEKVILVTLGPLTNVAEALQSEPSLADNLEMIYIMGGAVDVPGNLQVPGSDVDNAVAEWNIYVDPVAASIVFQSGAPITLVSLDATNQVPITMDFYERLEANNTTPEADFVYHLLALNQEFIQSGFYFFWDPLAAAIATDESLATIEERALTVVQEEGPESGQTLAAEGGSNIRVCISADGARFEQVFLDTLNAKTPIKVGLLTDLGPVDDNSFNETAWNGILKAQEELGIEAVYRESYGEPEWEPNINALIEEEGCDFIVTMGFYLIDITAEKAQANPDTKFAIVDVSYDPPMDNVLGIEYAIDEACFLIGYLAAGVTKTGILATYGGMDIPPVTLFMDGFAMGAEYYNQKHGTNVKVLGWDPVAKTGLFVDTFIDMEAGRSMGASLMDEGADIILPVCGIPGMGTAAVAQERGDIYVIGVDTDMTISAPDYADVYLTSALKKMDVTVFEVIKQVVDGTFQGGAYLGTLENNDVGLAPFHQLASLVPAELQAELDEIKQGIISGEIPTNPGEMPAEDYSNVFFMSLPPGLNMISLPLKPITQYTARSLAEELSATVVIRYDTELGKFVGFDLNAPGSGFPIKGGEGYIVNVPAGKTVAFAGAAWTNDPPAAPPIAQTDSAWAFVVSGSVDGSGAYDNTPLNVTVKNLRTGATATESVDPSGYFAAAWADLNRKAVIEVGDEIEVAVMDGSGQIVSGPFVYEVTLEGIRDALVNVRLRLGHIIPEKSALLQNYPNPFNPETWIPYQLRDPASVSIGVYNSAGALIRTLEVGHRDAGIYASRSRAAYWDGRNEAGEEVASGIYFYSITAGGFSATGKMTLKK